MTVLVPNLFPAMMKGVYCATPNTHSRKIAACLAFCAFCRDMR